MPVFSTSGSPTFNGDGTTTLDSTDIIIAPLAYANITQGWFAARVKPSWAAAAPPTFPRVFQFNAATNNIVAQYDGSTSVWRFEYDIGGVANNVSSATQGFTAGTTLTLIFAWESGTIKVSVNGAAFVTASKTGSSDTPTQFNIGNRTDGARPFTGDFYWAAYGSGTLSDADASNIHGNGNTDPTIAGLPGTPVFVWPADSATYLDTTVSFTNSVVPTVTGALSVGGTLTANTGTWTPTPSSFTYYWRRADDAASTNLVEIGASGATYTLSTADIGKFIQAGVIPH